MKVRIETRCEIVASTDESTDASLAAEPSRCRPGGVVSSGCRCHRPSASRPLASSESELATSLDPLGDQFRFFEEPPVPSLGFQDSRAAKPIDEGVCMPTGR